MFKKSQTLLIPLAQGNTYKKILQVQSIVFASNKQKQNLFVERGAKIYTSNKITLQ